MNDNRDRAYEISIAHMQQWCADLPKSLAKTDIQYDHEHYNVVFHITPVRSKDAASIETGFTGNKFDIWAGCYGLMDYACGEDPVIEYCTAIMAGGLTSIEYTLGRRVIACRTILDVKGDRQVETWFSKSGLIAPFLVKLGKASARVTNYPPY